MEIRFKNAKVESIRETDIQYIVEVLNVCPDCNHITKEIFHIAINKSHPYVSYGWFCCPCCKKVYELELYKDEQ